jgi:Kef-type K+ transport system membrane component KefB
MNQLATMLPALGASGDGHVHGLWWIILALVVFAIVSPIAYFWSRGGGQPQH